MTLLDCNADSLHRAQVLLDAEVDVDSILTIAPSKLSCFPSKRLRVALLAAFLTFISTVDGKKERSFDASMVIDANSQFQDIVNGHSLPVRDEIDMK